MSLVFKLYLDHLEYEINNNNNNKKDYLHPNQGFVRSENWEFSSGYYVIFGNGICDKVTFVSGSNVKKFITEFFNMASYHPVTWYSIWSDFLKLNPVTTDFSHLKHSTQDCMWTAFRI
jgi:hypothetical protein